MFNLGFGNPLPPVLKNLLIANVLVFLAQNIFEMQGISLEYMFALWGLKTGNFKVWQLVTHMFMHANFLHIAFNMYSFVIFGRILEERWGSKRFFQFYMICGIVSGLVQLVSAPYGTAIGASGAIMGVLAAFAYLFGETEMMLMFIPIPIKAKWLISAFILIDVFSAISPKTDDNIAHWAHIGGAAAGFLLVMYWNKTNRKTFY